jgi:hypothetical protein
MDIGVNIGFVCMHAGIERNHPREQIARSARRRDRAE